MKTIVRLPATWALLMGLFVLMGCSIAEQFKEMGEDSEKAKAAIESELGGEVQIEWRIDTGVTSVNVVFVKPPPGKIDLPDLKQRVTEIVNQEFRREIDQLTVSI